SLLTISRNCSLRRAPILRRSTARSRYCRTSRPRRFCRKTAAMLGFARRLECAKKKGRASARPEFREETPRRRTAEPIERMIHTAPHNLGNGLPESTPLDKNRWLALGFLIPAKAGCGK